MQPIENDSSASAVSDEGPRRVELFQFGTGSCDDRSMNDHPGYPLASAMTEEQLVQEIERLSPNTTVGISFLTDEMHRRRMTASSERMETMTQVLVDLTRKITTLTLVGLTASCAAVAVSLVALIRS